MIALCYYYNPDYTYHYRGLIFLISVLSYYRYCILFGTFDSAVGPSGTFELNKSHVCAFTIWGEGIVAIIAVILGLLAVLKVIIGKQA